jgi:hypothetical protein
LAAATVWPVTAAVAGGPVAAAQAAAGSMQADFNNDGFVDLAMGAPLEDIGAISDAGAINVIYGAASGLTTTGNQQFWQGAAGVAGTAESFDSFGFALT